MKSLFLQASYIFLIPIMIITLNLNVLLLNPLPFKVDNCFEGTLHNVQMWTWMIYFCWTLGVRHFVQIPLLFSTGVHMLSLDRVTPGPSSSIFCFYEENAHTQAWLDQKGKDFHILAGLH